MAEAESDVQRCDTPKSLEVAGVDELSDGDVEETCNSSSTFDFAEKSWKTDFILVVEGTRFYVARNILALASPVFDRMFESDFKESTTDELELPGKKADDVNEFLRAIYPSSASVMSKVNALKVLQLAEEYQVINLKRRCEEALLGSIDVLTSIEELYRLIKEAHFYSLKELLKRCVSLICEKSAEEIGRANREYPLPSAPLISSLQNVNDRLVTRVKQLELSNSHQAEQLETYKTWKNYFSKCLKKSNLPKFDEKLVWLGQTWISKIDLKKRTQVEHKINIWNTKLCVTFNIKSGMYMGMMGECIEANLKINDGNMIKCKFQIQFVVLNKMPSENHRFTNHDSIFSQECQSTECNIASLNDIEDPKKGFVYEDKVQVEVNVFMSEPEKL